MFKFETSKWFGENIRNHFISRTVGNRKNGMINMKTNEMETSVNMFRAHVKDRIFRERDSPLVVTKERDGGIDGRKEKRELKMELTMPEYIFHNM